jgi:hypothetical protein
MTAIAAKPPTVEQQMQAQRDYLTEIAPFIRIMADAITCGQTQRFMMHETGVWISDPAWTSPEWQAIYIQAECCIKAIQGCHAEYAK